MTVPQNACPESGDGRHFADFITVSGLPDARNLARWPAALAWGVQGILLIFAAGICALIVSAMIVSSVPVHFSESEWAALIVLAIFEGAVAWYIVARRFRMRRLLARGRAALVDGDFTSARMAFSRLLRSVEYRVSPRPALFGLAVADLREGNGERSKELLMRCGDYAPALELRALLLVGEGAYVRAVALMEQRKDLARRSAWTALLHAAALEGAGHRKRADALIRAAAEKSPHSGTLKICLRRLETDESLLELALDASQA